MTRSNLNLEKFPFCEIADNNNSIEELIIAVVIEVARASDLTELLTNISGFDVIDQALSFICDDLKNEFAKIISQVLRFYIDNTYGIKEVKNDNGFYTVFVNTDNFHYAIDPSQILQLNDAKYVSKIPKTCPHCGITPLTTNMRGIMGRPNMAWYWPFEKRASYAVMCGSCYNTISYEWPRIIDTAGYDHLNDEDQQIVMSRMLSR